MKLNNKTPKETVTEVMMKQHNEMMAEYREKLLTDDKLFRGEVLAKLEMIEQILSGISVNTYHSRELFG